MSENLFLKFLAKERILWRNKIERSELWGGFHERPVKSLKKWLQKDLEKALLNYEEMTTLLVEIDPILKFFPQHMYITKPTNLNL